MEVEMLHGTWGVLSVISFAWSVSLLRPQFLVLRPPPIGLDSNCELHHHWLKPFSGPSLCLTCRSQGRWCSSASLSSPGWKAHPRCYMRTKEPLKPSRVHSWSLVAGCTSLLSLCKIGAQLWTPAGWLGLTAAPFPGPRDPRLITNIPVGSQSQAPEHPELVLPALTLQIRSPLATVGPAWNKLNIVAYYPSTLRILPRGVLCLPNEQNASSFQSLHGQ